MSLPPRDPPSNGTDRRFQSEPGYLMLRTAEVLNGEEWLIHPSAAWARLRLVCVCHQQPDGNLPTDDGKLKTWSGLGDDWGEHREAVLAGFHPDPEFPGRITCDLVQNDRRFQSEPEEGGRA